MVNTEYFIARTYRLSSADVPGEEPLSHEQYLSFVESHRGLLIWFEETEQGKHQLQSPDRRASLEALRKTHAQAEFDSQKGHYKFGLRFRGRGYTISIEFDGMRPNRKWMLFCQNLAELLGGQLFTAQRKKPITREKLDELFPDKSSGAKAPS